MISSPHKSGAFAKTAAAAIVFAAVCALTAFVGPSPKEGSQAGVWYSVIPPLLAIVLAFLTHHVLLSLGIAILVGGFLTAVPQAPLSPVAWLQGLKTVGIFLGGTLTSTDKLQILAFIPPIFVMVEVTIASGGFKGIIVWLLKWVKGRKSA